MSHFQLLLLWATMVFCCGCMPNLTTLTDCRYSGYSTPEYVFVLPSLEQYATGSGDPPFYLSPDFRHPLRQTSFSYSRNFAGHRYRAIDTITGPDGSFRQWLLDDCRLLYSAAAP